MPQVSEDGKKEIQTGFYHHQWKTQFAEKGLNVAKLEAKVEALKMEIEMHQTKIEHTKANVKKSRRRWEILQ